MIAQQIIYDCPGDTGFLVSVSLGTWEAGFLRKEGPLYTNYFTVFNSHQEFLFKTNKKPSKTHQTKEQSESCEDNKKRDFIVILWATLHLNLAEPAVPIVAQWERMD